MTGSPQGHQKPPLSPLQRALTLPGTTLAPALSRGLYKLGASKSGSQRVLKSQMLAARLPQNDPVESLLLGILSNAQRDFTRPLAELEWQAASEEYVVGRLPLHASS